MARRIELAVLEALALVFEATAGRICVRMEMDQRRNNTL